MATAEQVELSRTRQQKYKNRRCPDLYFPKDIIGSKAFWELTATAIRVYMVFRNKIIVTPFIGSKSERAKKGKYTFPNIDTLQFTYKEAQETYGIPRATFRCAIDQLIEVGFIDLTKAGSGLHRDVSLYGISERWRAYGTDEFIVKKRPIRKQCFGFARGNTLGRNAGMTE